MSIGTSLGAFHEDEFQHSAGINTDPSIDNNVVDPDIDPEGVKPKPKPTTVPQPISDVRKDESPIKDVTSGFDNLRAPFGTMSPGEIPDGSAQGQVLRQQLDHTFNPMEWMQKAGMMAHDVGAGKVPMWGMDPETGEFHTTPEGLGAARSLMPFAVGGAVGGGMPVTIQLKEEGQAALQEGPDAFQQFMAGRGNRQQSNIAQPSETTRFPEQDARMGISPAMPERLRGQHPDQMSDADFYHYGEYRETGSMTPEQESRWRQLDSSQSQTHQFEQQPFDWEADIQRMHEDAVAHNKAATQRVKDSFQDNPDVLKNKGVSLLEKPYSFPDGNQRSFHFMNEDGNVGELSITQRRNGKLLWVPWMGTLEHEGAHTIGTSEVRALIPMLKQLYPNAEEIGGFRVSGARAAASSTGDALLRLKPKPPQRKGIGELVDILDGKSPVTPALE